MQLSVMFMCHPKPSHARASSPDCWVEGELHGTVQAPCLLCYNCKRRGHTNGERIQPNRFHGGGAELSAAAACRVLAQTELAVQMGQMGKPGWAMGNERQQTEKECGAAAATAAATASHSRGLSLGRTPAQRPSCALVRTPCTAHKAWGKSAHCTGEGEGIKNKKTDEWGNVHTHMKEQGTR